GLTSLSLRVIARTAGSPVLAISSVRRSAVPRPGGEFRWPELGDLEESGRIESNADAVLALWPERSDWEAFEGRGQPRDSSARRSMIVRALKGRQTGTGTVSLLWYPVLGTFEEARG
ncbi:MAG TPA: DnaB-like helicase C-terminal domain-containing protein, partial [Thermoanaerobaculia bacterium]|nr:DnaB-like helicase C-terminal domain-containing protein [Thermoanaerobaculia bacterium]